MSRYLIIFLLILSSCSAVKRADWHAHRAYVLNPSKYGDSSKIDIEVILHDTIRDTITVQAHDFSFTVDSLRSCLDSFTMVYSDSFVSIYGRIDSLGKLKFNGKVKERKVPFEVIVHDTVRVEGKCPPNITISEGYPKWYLWLAIGIFVVLIVLKFLK